jgi:hypothetical protein
MLANKIIRPGSAHVGAVIALTLVLLSCGYRFAGQGSLPADVTLVFIPIFENRTSETGVESIFTNDLIFQFTRNRKESIAPDLASADGVLRGTVESLVINNVARSSLSTATERRVTGVLRLQMESLGGNVLWSSGNIVESMVYSVVDDNKTATDRNKSDAIAVVSKKIAESAFDRLTDDF